jgi:hypothetical protein
MATTDRGLVARWLYEGGPARLWQRRPAIPAVPAIPRSAWRWAGITALAAGAVGGAYALWPRPLKQQLSPEAVRACIDLIAEVPTEYAARKLYRECLVIKSDAERVARWQEHGKAVAARNQRCSGLGYWKPGSTLGSECSIPEPPKPQR